MAAAVTSGDGGHDRFAHLFEVHEPWKVNDENFRTPGYKGAPKIENSIAVSPAPACGDSATLTFRFTAVFWCLCCFAFACLPGFVPRLRFQSGACFTTTNAIAKKEFAETQLRLQQQNTLGSARSARTAPIAPTVTPLAVKSHVAVPRPQSAKPTPSSSSASAAARTSSWNFEKEQEKPWLQDQKDFRVPGLLFLMSSTG